MGIDGEMEIMASSARCCTIAHVRIVADKQLENLEYVCYLVVALCVLPESVSITLQLGLCSFRNTSSLNIPLRMRELLQQAT